MAKAVTESDKGTMTEVKGSSAPEAEVKTPEEVSKVSPKVEEDPKLYSQKDFDAASQIFKSEEGRLRKEAEDERDEAKSRILEIETDVEDIQAERDKLQTDLEDMASDDSKRFDVIKRDKELRDAQRTLKTATAELATERKASEADLKFIKDENLATYCWDIAAERHGEKPIEEIAQKLKGLCVTVGKYSKEEVGELADTLWEKDEANIPDTKAGKEEVKEKLILDTGKTHGSGEKTRQEILDEMYPTMEGKKS